MTPQTSPQDSPPRRPWSLDPFTGPLESTPEEPAGPARPSRDSRPTQTALFTPPWGLIHNSGLRPSTALPGTVRPAGQHPHRNQLAVALGSAISTLWSSVLLGPLQPSSPPVYTPT